MSRRSKYKSFHFVSSFDLIFPTDYCGEVYEIRTSMLKARVFPNYKHMIRIIHFCIVLTANTCSLHENQHYHV